jgi:hypothetical protein
MANLNALYEALRRADAAGDTESATKLTAYIKQQTGLDVLEAEQQKQHLAKTGFMPALKAAGREALGSAEQALGEATNSEYLKQLAEEQKQKAAGIYEPITEEDVAAAKEKGVMPYLGALATKHVTEPIGGIVGEYGVPTVGGIVAGALAPEAIGATAIAGMGAEEAATAIAANAARKRLITGATTSGINYPTTVGENIQAQKEAHPGEPIDLAKAAIFGLPQAALVGFGLPGGAAIEKALGSRVLEEANLLAPKVAAGEITRDAAIQSLQDKGLNFAQKMAANTAVGTAMMAGTEELRRAQAGQEGMTAGELGQTILSAGILSPIFSMGHVSAEETQAKLKLDDAQKKRYETIAKEAKTLGIPKAVTFAGNEPHLIFPDGTSRSKSEMEKMINELPPEQQAMARDQMTTFFSATVPLEYKALETPEIAKPELTTDETLTELGIKKSTPLVKKGELKGLDLTKPEEADHFISGLTAFKDQKGLNSEIKYNIEKKIEEVQTKLKEAEDERLRAERDRGNLQVPGESRYAGTAGEPTEPIRLGATEPPTDFRSADAGTEGRYSTLEAPKTEILKSEKELAPKVEVAKEEPVKTTETPDTILNSLKERFGSNVQKSIEQGNLKLIESKDVPDNVASDAVSYFDKGVAHLITDRLSKEEAPRKLLHEVGTHYGLEGMVGKNLYRDILRTVNRLSTTDPAIKEAVDYVNARYKDLLPGTRSHAEEVLARVGESAPNHNLWRRMVAAVKEFLYKKGLWNPNRMDVRDLHDLINRSTQKSLEGKIKTVAKEGIQYAKAELPISDKYKDTAIFSPPGEHVDEAFKTHVENFGKQVFTKEGREKLGTNLGVQFLDGRIKVAYAGAGIQTKLIKDFNGAVLDATKGVRADILYDQALNGNILGSVSAKSGKVIFDSNGVAKVVDSPDHISAIFEEQSKLAKRIGANDARHVSSAYLQALRYEELIGINAELDKEIKKTKNKNLVKKLEDQKKYISEEQRAAIPKALAYEKEFPEVKEMRRIYDQVNKDQIDLLESAGIYSKEYADKLRKTKGYVPMYRVMDDLEAFNPGARQHFRGLADLGKEHAFEGSDRQTIDVLDNMLTRHMWAVNAAVRNNANRQLMNQLAVLGEDGKPRIYDGVIPEKADVMAPVWINGQRKFVEYTDPHFALAVHGLEPSLGPILGMFANASRTLRIGVTALPPFQAYQVFNDATRAAMLSGVKHPFKLMGEVMTSFYKVAKDPNDPILKELNRLGISGGYGHNAREISDKLRRDMGITANSLTKQALDKAESFAAASDMAQRHALYKRTLLETGGELQADDNIVGGNRVLAMDRAMNIIHWQKHGTSNKVRVLSQVVPFMNAYVQGMDILVRAMRGEGISGLEKKQAKMLFLQT